MVLETAALCLVLAVTDGDTLKVRCDGVEPLAVRVALIDAPESGQAHGRASGQSLRKLCLHTRAWVQPQTVDRYGRTVAHVQCRGKDAAHHQVERGMAWAYRAYPGKDAARFARLLVDEEHAQASARGLWRNANSIPPWQWRHQRRGG